MIAVPIVAFTTVEARKGMRKALRTASLVELRLDFIKDINLNNLERLLSCGAGGVGNVIVTDRKNRLGLIRKAIEFGVGFVDLDILIGEKIIKEIIIDRDKYKIADNGNNKGKDKKINENRYRKKEENKYENKNGGGDEKANKNENKIKTKIIVSFHNFKKTNKNEVLKKYNLIKSLNPDVIKIATFANSIEDNIVIFDLIKKSRKENREIIAVCMGEKGEISRILSPLFGGFLTFASLDGGKVSAPGQIDVNLLNEVYGIDKLDRPKIFGLVGNPVNHSRGIFFHNDLFRKSGINGIYLNFLVDDLKLFLKEYRSIVSGFSVTIPFKTEVIRYIDELDDSSRKIGAVNTVINRNGKLIGYNTDMVGAIKAVESQIKIKGKKVLMIGAGGVARAIGYGIMNRGGKLIILNRTLSRAKKLAMELGCEYGGFSELDRLMDIDLIINATSIGMFPHVEKIPIDIKILKKIIHKGTVVFDSVYNPRDTRFLGEAKMKGCKIVYGDDMFINQAKEQFKLFTGRNIK